MGNTQSVKCDNCGSTNMTLQGDYFICAFCNTAVHKSQFKQKSNKQSKYEAEYEHRMKIAEAYERQDNIDSAKYEYMTLLQNYPYRHEAYAKLLPLLMSEYNELKDSYSIEDVMIIEGIEVTNHIHTKYAVGNLGNSGKITMRESDDKTEAQDGQLCHDYLEMDKLLDCIEAYYDDMQGLSNADQMKCSALMSDVKSFIESETEELEELDDTLQERHQCELLLQRKYCHLYNIYTMFESKKTYKFDDKSREEYTTELNRANSALSVKTLITAILAVGGTLLALVLSLRPKGSYVYFLPTMIPVSFLVYMMYKQIKKSKADVRCCQFSIEKIDKKTAEKENSIALWRKEVDMINDELKNSRFTLPTDIFGQN